MKKPKYRQATEPGFKKFCRKLGVRHQGCLEVEVFSSGAVRAIYAASSNHFLGIRTVWWLRPPGRRICCNA